MNGKENTIEKTSVMLEWSLVRKIKEFFNKPSKTPSEKLTPFQFSDEAELKTGEELWQYAQNMDLNRPADGSKL